MLLLLIPLAWVLLATLVAGLCAAARLGDRFGPAQLSGAASARLEEDGGTAEPPGGVPERGASRRRAPLAA